MAATLNPPTAAFYVDVPAASGSSSSSPATTTASSNVLKRVASTGLDSASDAGTSVVPDSIDGEGEAETADLERAQATGEGDDAGREKKRARRSDNGLEPVHYTPSLQPLRKPGSAALTTSLTAPNTLPGPSGASRKPLSTKGSRNLSPGGCKMPGEDDDSSGLSSLESDDDDASPPAKAAPAAVSKSGKPKRTVVAPPPKVVAAAPKARSKPALKVVSPPSVTRFLLPAHLPSSSVIAKLYIREFFVRFHGLMPCLSLTARQSTRTARVVLTALEEPERFWGPGADVNQRVLLEACLDLLIDDFKHLYEGVLEAERRAWVEEAIEDVAQAKKSASVDVAAVPWATVWAGIKEGKTGGWGKLEREWTAKRDQAEENGEKARRAVKGEIGLEKRLACMCALVDLCTETQAVRKDMNNGIDTERSTRIDLNNQKSKLKKILTGEKQKVTASKPEVPSASPSKAAAAKAKWREEVAKVTKEIKQLEKDNEMSVRRIHHDIHLTTTAYRIRLSPSGSDIDKNEYYIPAPTSDTPYPTDAESDMLPLSWTVLIHGRSFSPLPKQPVPRAADDEWFVVGEPSEIQQLADYVEFRAKKAKLELEAAQEKAKGKKKAEVEEPVDASDLVSALRGFADFILVERARAHEEPMSRRETRGRGV